MQRTYFRLCAQGSVLLMMEDPDAVLTIELGSAAFTAVLSIQSVWFFDTYVILTSVRAYLIVLIYFSPVVTDDEDSIMPVGRLYVVFEEVSGKVLSCLLG